MTRTIGRTHHHALELLERALGYTRGALATVGPDRSAALRPARDGAWPTCSPTWTTASTRSSRPPGAPYASVAWRRVRVPTSSVLQTEGLPPARACGAHPTPPTGTSCGDRLVPSGLLVSAAALEITVHGWDVGQATGARHGLPDDLARALMPVAHLVVTPDDRPGRFAMPRLTHPDAGSGEVLLGFLGRA